MLRSLVLFVLVTGAVCGANENAAALKETAQGLKDVYAGTFLIGTAGDIPGDFSEAELINIRKHYDIITPENCMKPEPIHPAEDTYDFSTTDALVDWCEQNDIKVWGHTLLWHSQTGHWFFQGDDNQPVSRELALERLKKHIFTVAQRYKGRLIGWDVVNEAIEDNGAGVTENLRNSSWYKTVGPEVLTLAFEWAHEADPNAQLYYNDYNIEQGALENKGKHASSMILLKRLINEGVPIDGVGIQGHWYLDTNLAEIEKAITNYASLGLRISITEMDVAALKGGRGTFRISRGPISSDNYKKQAKIYKELFEMFKRHADVIDRITLWGVSDTRSWRRGQEGLLFDGQLNPKPAFKAVFEAAPNLNDN